jgi:hypothetical protein
LTAISKHLIVLEKIRLIIEQRRGKGQMVYMHPFAIKGASGYLRRYEAVWNGRFDRVDKLLKTVKK